MFLQKDIEEKKNIQKELLDFLNDDDENAEQKYSKIIKFLDDQKIRDDKYELKSFLHLISRISNNHYRNSCFIKKITQILSYFKNEIQKNFSNQEIFDIFELNKIIHLFLIKEKIIEINELIVNKMTKYFHQYSYIQYFYPEIKNFLTEKIKQKYPEPSSDNFEENRQKGENDSYICHLIRNDLIEDFISYINKNNISVRSQIIPSIFETNLAFLKREQYVSLIEYAAFFGSIQIFQYLRMNNADLTENLWIYSIHGNNADIIHLLEDDKCKVNDKSFTKCYEESIMCHHNDIAHYIENVHLESIKNLPKMLQFIKGNSKLFGINNYNYEFFSNNYDEYKDASILSCLIQNDYYKIVEFLMKSENIDVNMTVSEKKSVFGKISNINKIVK